MKSNNSEIIIEQPPAQTAAKLFIVLFLLFAFLHIPLFAIEDELRQIRTLADRGQFGPVEELFRETIERSDITDIDKIRLATELVRSRSMQLLAVEPAQRDRIVRSLESLESTYLAGSTDTLSVEHVLARITLRLQLAMAHQSFGDYQRLEADVASVTHQPAAYQRARSILHDAIERFKLCQREFQALRQRMGMNAPLALEYAITMQLGIAQKSLALTLSAEAERNFELRQAAETLSELASINSTDPVIVQCKVEKAACHRLVGELERCAETLTPLLNAALTTPVCRLRVEAEWIRTHITARTNIIELRRQYATDRPDSRLYPDFDLARLELFLVSDPGRNIRPEHAAARRLQDTIGRELGTYWGRRANMTVSVMTAGSTDLASAQMLATLAENLYREQQFAESADMFEQAAAKADANRQADEMYRYNRSAVAAWDAAIKHLPPGESTIDELTDELTKEYENRLIPLLQKLVRQNPNHPEAQGLHATAIRLQTQRITEQPEVLNECAALIKEHAELWTESPALPVLRRWLIIHWEQRGRTDEATALLPLLDLEQLGTLPPEIQRLRVRQLDTESNTQEAVEILTALLKQRREPATLQLLAEILSRQTDAKKLNDALNYWGELVQNTAQGNETWWAAREGIIDVLIKLNRHDEAKQNFDRLRVLRPDLGGAERKERLMKRFAGR